MAEVEVLEEQVDLVVTVEVARFLVQVAPLLVQLEVVAEEVEETEEEVETVVMVAQSDYTI